MTNNMQMPAEQIESAINHVLDGRWRVIHATRSLSGDIFVLEDCGQPSRTIAVRRQPESARARPVHIPAIGAMFWHDAIDDAAFVGLRELLRRYQHVRVLRYRPGKRITLAADDASCAAVVVKYVTGGVRRAFDALDSVWAERRSLGFDVSEPLLHDDELRCFVQRHRPGVPLDFGDGCNNTDIAGSMATAIATLHASDAMFESTFRCADQERRSARYVERMRRNHPDLHPELQQLSETLAAWASALDEDHGQRVPIHGSLHSHQWLRGPQRLVLVDFDRAAMGHAELDLATFIAECDYEPAASYRRIAERFLDAYGRPVKPQLFAYYRAHKHLAKAYKASKAPAAQGVEAKTSRNLQRALALVRGAGGGS